MIHFSSGKFLISRFRYETEFWHLFSGLVPTLTWQRSCGWGEKQFSSAPGHKTLTLKQVFPKAFLMQKQAPQTLYWALSDKRSSFSVHTYWVITVMHSEALVMLNVTHTVGFMQDQTTNWERHNWLFKVQLAFCLRSYGLHPQKISRSYKLSHAK